MPGGACNPILLGALRYPDRSTPNTHSTHAILTGVNLPVDSNIEPPSSTSENRISESPFPPANTADITRRVRNPDRLSTIQHVLSTIKERRWCPVCWSLGFLGGNHRMKARWDCQHSSLQKERLRYSAGGLCHRCGVASKLCSSLFEKPRRPMCQWPGIVVPVVINAWSVPELRRKLIGMLTGEDLREDMTMDQWKNWLGGSTQLACQWECAAMAVFDAIVMINEEHCHLSSNPRLRTFFDTQESNSRRENISTNENVVPVFQLPPRPTERSITRRNQSPGRTNRLAAIKDVLASITRNRWCGLCWSLSFINGSHDLYDDSCPQHSRLRTETPPKMFMKGHVCIYDGNRDKLCGGCLSPRNASGWPSIVFPIVLNAWRVPEMRRLLVRALEGEGLSIEMSEEAWRAWLEGETQMACGWSTPAMAAFDVIVMINEGYRG
ncbi:hypothetical protein K440DRAFT_646338 [Wilcoxina mikolae CBS 423.85]|nr:hypothetical protein K440DRAFT_646338 [Wilcoxina mikolae CBS 423.85]